MNDPDRNSARFLLYGSTGYSGNLIARFAVKQGLRPILAGRNVTKLKQQSRELGLEYRVVRLHQTAELERTLQEVALVLHCAGPFIHTFKPMVNACLNIGTHYLDIAGELSVFESLCTYGEQAKARGVMLMPGVGMEIVATDCLAAYLKQRLPAATHLLLAWGANGPANFSRGSSLTMLERGVLERRIRRQGQLELVCGDRQSRLVDLGYGPVTVIPFPWPDVFTAFYSTGIPNIETYYQTSSSVLQMTTARNFRSRLSALTPVKNLLKLYTHTRPIGPTELERSQTRTFILGQVQDESGHSAIANLQGPQGYTWTAMTAVNVVQELLRGKHTPGFQTPAMLFGADFVLHCHDVIRIDVA